MLSSQPTMLERAFDYLSAFPYLNLKVIMKRLWKLQLVFTPAVYLVGFLLGNPEAIKEMVNVRTCISYVLGAVAFGYMFHLWDRRDRERIRE